MDQTSHVWRKKIKAMEKAEPQALEYPLVTTAKYLHPLDTLYENQEIELKIKNTKLKEAECNTHVLHHVKNTKILKFLKLYNKLKP